MPDIGRLLIIDQTLQKMINDYLLLPGAEGLVPLNPTRLPSYIGGVILSQDLNLATDLVGAPLNNLRVAGTYLTTSHNVTHGARRAMEVALDTTKINMMAESVPVVGPALAGQHANACAKKYSTNIVTDYKLVDSVKRKALQSKWSKRFGKDFVRSVTTPRPARPTTTVNTPIDLPGNLTVPGMANNNSRPLWSKKFFGGGGAFIHWERSSMPKTSQIGIILSILLASYGVYVIVKNRRARKSPMVEFIPLEV